MAILCCYVMGELWVIPLGQVHPLSRLWRDSLVFCFVLWSKAFPAYFPSYTEVRTSALHYSSNSPLKVIDIFNTSVFPVVTYATVFFFGWKSLLVDAEQKTFFASLLATALWFPVPAVRAAPCSHSAHACHFFSGDSGMGSGLCQGSACAGLQVLCPELHIPGSSQFVPIPTFGSGSEAIGGGLWNSCLTSQGF